MIRFYKPTIRRKDMNAVLQTLVDEKIGPGERKRQFATDFCTLAGLKYGLMLRSRFDALKLALRCLHIEEGDSIGMSVLSPRFYAIAVKELGGKVKFGDINAATGCLAEAEARRLVEEGCKMIILHEPMGMIPLHEPYKDMGVPLIEDMTESLGSFLDADKPGIRGDIVLCAFEEEDMISSAGGSVIMTNSKDLRDSWTPLLEGVRSYVEMPDMNAALGIIQCATFSEQLEKRRTFYRLFQKSLLKTRHKVFGISALEYEVNGYGFAVLLDSKIEDVMKFATKYQVSSQKTFAGCAGADKSDDFDHFPNAIPAMLRCISFPLYPFISQSDNDMLVKVISHLP